MKIALLDDYQGVALICADWKGILPGADITVFRDHLADEDALARRLEGFEVIGIMRERTPFPATLLRRLPKLKLLVTTGHRNDSVDVKAAKAQGITVCGTPSSAHAAAELTWALVMAAARRIDLETRSFHDGGWQVGLGRDLKGATLGVIGLGRLGSLVAGYGRAFGMKVIAWSQNLTAERAAAGGATLVRPTRREPTRAPRIEPIPPMTMTTKVRIRICSPMPTWTETSGPAIAPAKPARTAPAANSSV